MLDYVVSISGINTDSEVLEIGSGTGVLGKQLGTQVKSYIGIDISPEMVRIANEKQSPDTFYLHGDAVDLGHFTPCQFDAVFARMILHHLTHGLSKCLQECYKVLKQGGRLIVCENFPLAAEAEEFQKKCLDIKEERITFKPDTLRESIESAGFTVASTKEIVLTIRLSNWIDNNNLDKQRAERIKQMFVGMSDKVKQGLRCRKVGDDWLFETKFLILSAKKK